LHISLFYAENTCEGSYISIEFINKNGASRKDKPKNGKKLFSRARVYKQSLDYLLHLLKSNQST
jgi:hypothetical protein